MEEIMHNLGWLKLYQKWENHHAASPSSFARGFTVKFGNSKSPSNTAAWVGLGLGLEQKGKEMANDRCMYDCIYPPTPA